MHSDLRFWLIDDLAHRREAHAQVLEESGHGFEYLKVPHPLKLREILIKPKLFLETGLNTKINLFLSDYNMHWHNVEWLDGSEAEVKDKSLLANGFDNFPGTVKVLEEQGSQLNQFMLIMLSTMVVPYTQSGLNNRFKETEDEEWTHQAMPLASLELTELHKITKPFNQEKLQRLLENLRYNLS